MTIESPERPRPAAPVEDVQGWCTLYRNALPALSPTPAGRELEALDRYVERYEQLAAEIDGVSTAATSAARRLADAYAELRVRVGNGEPLRGILEAESLDPESVVFSAGVEMDGAAHALCG